MSLSIYFTSLYGLTSHGCNPGNRSRYTQTCVQIDDALSTQSCEIGKVTGESLKAIFQVAWALTLSRQLSVERVQFDVSDGSRKTGEAFDPIGVRTLSIEVGPDSDIRDLPTLIQAPETQVDCTECRPSGPPNIREPRSLLVLADNQAEFREETPPSISTWDVIAVVDPGGSTMLSWHHPDIPQDFVATVLHHFVILSTDVLKRLKESFNSSPSTPMPTRTLSQVSDKESSRLRDLAQPLRPFSDINNGSIHQKFRKQAFKTPDAPALENERGNILTYRQLDWITNQFASQLASKVHSLHMKEILDGGGGIEGTYTVGIMLGRTLGVPISMLACWKAGLAAVMLDPSHPKTRNEYIIKDARCSIVLIDKPHPDEYDNTWVCNFEELCCVADHASARAHQETGLDMTEFYHRLCWINYTSGSTGFPKGVRQSHATFGTLICAFDHLPPQKNLLFFNPVSTAATIPLWCSLITGGSLCIVPQSHLGDLGGCIRNHSIESVYLTPSALKLLQSENVPSLKRLMLGGESIPAALVSKWSKSVEVVPMYGTTELGCPYWKPYKETGDKPPMLSRPVTDVSVYILRPGTSSFCGFYEPGELCFSTTHLTSGYIGLPEQTDAVFVKNPFASDTSHRRLYRSGDLGTMTPSGQIAILGRIDQQIKIDGNRVDPGEVESVLIHLDGVKTATVLQIDLEHGGSPLVACLVLQDTSGCPDPDWETIVQAGRDRCAERLPVYMAPQRWVRLDRIPLTPTGKTDLKALRSEITEIFTSLGRYEKPLTPSEEALVKACQVAQIGSDGVALTEDLMHQMLDASFLENGGSSLSAMLVKNYLPPNGWEITLGDLYATTLRKAACQMRKIPIDNQSFKRSNKQRYSFPLPRNFPVAAEDIELVYPASTFQCEMFITSLKWPRQNCLYRYLDLSHGGYSHSQIREALQLLLEKKPILRTILVPCGAQIPTSNEEDDAPFAIGDQRLLNVQLKCNQSFHWAESFNATTPLAHYAEDVKVGWAFGEYLWRASLLRGTTILALVFHHVISDAWSLDLSNLDLYQVLEGIKHRDEASDDTALSMAIGKASRPSPEEWVLRTYGSKGLDGHDPHPSMKRYTKVWVDYLKDVKPTYLTNVKYLSPLPTEQPPVFQITETIKLDYKPVCRCLNITTGAFIHATWALTLANLAHLDLRSSNEITYYRYGGNRDSHPGAAEIEGALLTLSPMRLELDPTESVSGFAKTVMQTYATMRPAEPYYVDEPRPGGPQGFIRPYGNTALNHVVYQGNRKVPHMFPDLIEGRGFYCEKTAFFCLELFVVADDQPSGGSLTLCPEYCIEESIVRRMLSVFEGIAKGIVESYGTKTVAQLVGIRV
ncbi:hypothetical protein BBP40_003373 [Aspergillus hancockii]|nr:hypothetical protein BBP40_003373 [Aspergillus hancockii]